MCGATSAFAAEDMAARSLEIKLELVNDGLISEEDALEYSDNPEALKMNFQGIFLSAGDNSIIG